MSAKGRVLKNSAVMYLKMILSIGITFYSTRIILKALGVEDFGIYNLVAGAVSLLGFFNGSISNTIQRYLAYGMGKGEEQRLRDTFNLSLSLNIILALIICVALEIFGIWGFDDFFVIPKEKMHSAYIAYQIMIGTTAVSIIATPFNAAFNAHEDLIVLSIVEFVESLLKLAAAFILLEYMSDRLILYCILLFAIHFASLAFKYFFSYCHYSETRKVQMFKYDKGLLREMLPFIGWNALEASSWLGKNQGVAVLMNTLYGTVVNAAYGVATQINGPVVFFSSTLLNSIRPQIYKSGGANDYNRMIGLSVMASKFAFLILLCFFIPFSFLLPYVLKVWLTVVPEYSERFSILLLSITMISYLSIGMNIAIQAHGKVKQYQLVSSIIILLSLPIGYAIYCLSHDVYMFLYVMVAVEIISVMTKYYMSSLILPVTFMQLIRSIFAPCACVAIVSICIGFAVEHFMGQTDGVLRNIAVAVILFVMTMILSYAIGFDRHEKKLAKEVLHHIFKFVKI